MSEECNHNCNSCTENCESRNAESMLAPMNDMSDIKKVIGIISGKGGVGKSLVTSLLAVLSQRNGYKTAVLDADITGPSIPKIFGIKEKAFTDDMINMPCESKNGIDVMSVNLLLENDTDPVIWRGPIIAGAVKQFWSDITWGDVDFMFIDMPPGTGDVPLTVFQSIPVDGIIIVTSPQELVSMIVEKAVNMAEAMNIPVLGIVENMSYIECPDCHKRINVFGESKTDEIAKGYGIPVIAKIPLRPEISKYCDEGRIEEFEFDFMNTALDILKNINKKG